MVIEADEVLRYTSDTDDDPHIAIWLEPPLQVNTGPGPFPPPTASGPFPSLTNFGTLDFVTSNQTTSFLIAFRSMPASSEGTVVHNAGSMRIEARDGGAVGISGTTYHSFRFEKSGRVHCQGRGRRKGLQKPQRRHCESWLDRRSGRPDHRDRHGDGIDHSQYGRHPCLGFPHQCCCGAQLRKQHRINSGLIRAEKLGGAADATAISIAPITGLTSIVNDGEITGDYAVRSGAISDRAVLEILIGAR